MFSLASKAVVLGGALTKEVDKYLTNSFGPVLDKDPLFSPELLVSSDPNGITLNPSPLIEPDMMKAECLAWVNALRTEYNRPPLGGLPVGLPRQPTHCPIALALRDLDSFVHVGSELVAIGSHKRPMPAPIKKFIISYDTYMFPELMRPSALHTI